jgi:hypothetical protein
MSNASASEKRPYLGIQFECCQVYQRVYRDPSGRFYNLRCPKCLRGMRVRVGKGGSANRFFKVRF